MNFFDIVFLQMIFDLDEVLKMFEVPTEIQGVETVTSFVPYIAIGIFIFLLFLVIRIFKNIQAYPNDESRIGKVKINWQGNCIRGKYVKIHFAYFTINNGRVEENKLVQKGRG